jgi:hypothetical protein
VFRTNKPHAPKMSIADGGNHVGENSGPHV